MSFLCISVRFLQPLVHGRSDGGEPEWPPSPLRLFQALVAAAAGRWNERQLLAYAAPALKWLESQGQPLMTAPDGLASEVRTQFYVPDNTADRLVPQFKKGIVDATPKRTEKVVRPTHLKDGALHYLYPLAPEGCPHLEVIRSAARSITHLGWGIDMVAADAEVITEAEAAKLPGHRWCTVQSGGVPLRVPRPGTLQNLIEKHTAFLGRVSDEGFRPVPPLNCFDTVRYHSETVPQSTAPVRPYAAFKLLSPDMERTRPFNPLTHTRSVAGLLRHLLGENGSRFGLTPDEVRELVHGHLDDNTPLRGTSADQRLMFLPLPTINAALNRVESIRRVLLVGPAGARHRIEDLQRRLSGENLEHNGQPLALLNLLPRGDGVLRQYTGESEIWSTVTPAVFPRHHKGDLDKGNEIACRMFKDAGLPDPAELWWRPVGFRRGAELARKYERPTHMTGPMFHVRVRFPRKVQGPIAIGAGRYRGFGLLAQDS